MEEFEFSRCYKMAKEINTKYIPQITEAYNSYIKIAKRLVQENDVLNQSRSMAELAVFRLKNGYGTRPEHNQKVAHYLGELKGLNVVMKEGSRDLNNILSNNQSWFKSQTEKLMMTNNEILRDIKGGSKAAKELEVDLQQLAKDIANLINKVLPSKITEIESFVKKIENKVVDNVHNYANSIKKLDGGVLQGSKYRIWSDVDSEFLRNKASFYDTDYRL